MKLGFFVLPENPWWKLPYSYAELLQHMVEAAVVAEQAGFHSFWMGEHHFGGEGFDTHPNPIVSAAYVAARTKKIRIGLAAIIVPYWHPLRVAEDVALLDQLSGGRVECGVGRGLAAREATNLNLDADRRNEERNWALFKETIQIMKKAWTEDPFTWDGDFYKFPYPGVQDSHTWYPRNPAWRSETGEYIGMSIQPKPFQKPHPPLWNVLDKTPGFVVAAELGMKPITWLRAREGLKEAFRTYQEAASRVQGRQLRFGEDCGLMRTTFVAETMEEARKISEPVIDQMYNIVSGQRARDIYAEPGETIPEKEFQLPWFDFLMKRDHLLIGTPESVAEKINELQRDYNFEFLMPYIVPGLEHEHVMRSLDLFAERVMPLIKEKEPVAG